LLVHRDLLRLPGLGCGDLDRQDTVLELGLDNHLAILFEDVDGRPHIPAALIPRHFGREEGVAEKAAEVVAKKRHLFQRIPSDQFHHHSFLVDIELPQPDPQDLRGRQSVRATFKLSSRAIDALSIVAVHLGIKQKSLFDHLIEDVPSLNAIAREIEAGEFRTLARVQKTFVISRRTLNCLEDISREFNAPRDALVEYSIQRLLPVITREREKHRKRKKLLEEIRRHLEDGRRLLEKSHSLLGAEDPVAVWLEAAVADYRNACGSIEHFVERGDIIEAF